MPRHPTQTQAPDLDALTGKLWAALCAVEALLDHERPEVRLKAAGSMAALAGVYARLYPQRESAQTWGAFTADLARRYGTDPHGPAFHGADLAPEADPGDFMRAAARRAQLRRTAQRRA